MFWTTLQTNAKSGGIGLALIAAGALGQSMIDKSSKLPWLHQQAAVAHKLQTVDLPKEKAHAECEHKRANIAETTAIRSEEGHDVNLAAIPDCPEPTKR